MAGNDCYGTWKYRPSSGPVFCSITGWKTKLFVKALLSLYPLIEFWNKARSPLRQEVKCRLKLEKQFELYVKLKTGRERVTESQRRNEEAFRSTLDLFVIAHQNALSDSKVLEEDEEDLRGQREKGWRGCMAREDKAFTRQEVSYGKKIKRIEQTKKKKNDCTLYPIKRRVVTDSSSSESEISGEDAYQPPLKRKSAEKKTAIDPARSERPFRRKAAS